MIWGFALVPGVYSRQKTGQTRYYGQSAEILVSDLGREYFARCCGAVFPEYAVEYQSFCIACIKICLKTKYSFMRLTGLEIWIGTILLYYKCKQLISNDEI
jgi:hypothetical protein